MNEPTMKDSGERREFNTGAVRDRGGFKPRPDLISPHANLREGAWLAVGAEKYGERNYEKGMPISDCVASLTRHLEAYKLGLTDEDHAAAIRTNAGFILHFEEEIKAGRLPADLDDMPHYATPKPGDRRINPVTGQIEVYVKRINADPNGDSDVIACPDQRSLSDEYPDKFVPTFYVAGPMRGYQSLNFRIFDEVAEIACGEGYNIISPADLDREHGIDPINDPESVKRAFTADPNLGQTIVRRDTEVIIELKKDRGDGLILLPGWQNSTGTRAETALALWLELKFKTARYYLGDNGEHGTWTLEDADPQWVSGRLFNQKYTEGE